MNITVELDTSNVVSMLDGLAQRTRGRSALWGPLRSASEQGAAMISNVRRGTTGELAGSVKAGGRDGPGLIVSDVEYARFVFGGTRYTAPSRPTVPAGAIASILASEIAQVIFR